jgi:hypothetical protein
VELLDILAKQRSHFGPRVDLERSCADLDPRVRGFALTLLSYNQYLLKLVLADYKDAPDDGTEFHYSWLIIPIDLMGWVEPKYSFIYPISRKCHATIYTILWHTLDEKHKKVNSIIFNIYYDKMQENIDNTWRIPPKVVEEDQIITHLKAYRHSMWIQAKRDPKKEWSQLRYCVKK